MSPAATTVLDDPAHAVARALAAAEDPVRLAVLRRTGLLDAGVQESLQRYTRLAAKLTESPVSTVTLIDADRQYIPGAYGTELEQTPLDVSFCKHVMADDATLAISDARQDAFFAANRGTTDFGMRAYLGAPVRAGGAQLGALCVIDRRPRAWTDDQREILDDLSTAVATDIELRLRVVDQETMATTDPLTGLGNRRALALRIEEALEQGSAEYVAMIDLDGFKAYNDAFGHPAGDDLLRRIGQRLIGVCQGRDAAFRMGGDEFCIVAEQHTTVLAAQRAATDQGPGFHVTASLGAARLLDDARDVTAAISVADQRMYNAKRGRGASTNHQVTSVLISALAERDGVLGGHSSNVSRLAREVGESLRLEEGPLRAVETAAILHDIGKMAISDAILGKPGPLNDEEWAQIRSHTLIGERIIASAPALSEVSRLVRSSHERFDGGGYPDGLAASEIPLGSMIVCACDAYDAMTSDRPYRAALSHADACAELARQAGRQFDPRVVAAILGIRTAPPAA